MTVTLIILVLTVLMFAIGRLRSDIVALCALSALLLFGILTPVEAFSGFSSTVVIMMVGLFVVGGAIMQTGLAKAVGGRIMKLAGGSDTALFLLVVIVTSVIGAFVSNTGTVALMMPIVVGMASRMGMHPARLLMPLAFASSMGGMLTLIGTPPNLVIQDTLTGAGLKPLGFFSFLPVGVVCMAVGIVVMLPLCRMLLNKNKKNGVNGKGKSKTLDALVKEYRLNNGVSRYLIKKSSLVRGKSVAELDLRNRYGLSILEIRNEKADRSGLIRNVTQSIASPERVLEVDDIIYILGDKEKATAFAKTNGLERLGNNNIDFYELGIAEIVLMPESRLIGVTVRNSGFRERYSINVLGIRRNKEYLTDSLPEEKLHSGDVLLVQGKWDNISRLGNEEDDWVVLGQPEKKAQEVILNYKAPLAAVIMLAMVAAMVFDFIPIAPVTAVTVAALLMVICGCFRNVEAAYKTINWESIILSRHDANVGGFGEDGSFGNGFPFARIGSRLCGTGCIALRSVFHNLVADNVYKQHGYGGSDGTYSTDGSGRNRRKSLSIPFCGNSRGEHVLCFAVFNAAQRSCNARRRVHIRRLCKSGLAPAGDNGNSDDVCPAVAVSFLNNKV